MNDYIQLTAKELSGQMNVFLILEGIILLIFFSVLFAWWTDEGFLGFACGVIAVGVLGLAFAIIWNADGIDDNVTKFEESYGVSVSSFVPKGSNDKDLSDTLKATTKGSNEYIYSYHDGLQTVTINIDTENRLRMFDDDGAVIPSGHKRSERLHGDKKNDAKAKDRESDRDAAESKGSSGKHEMTGDTK